MGAKWQRIRLDIPDHLSPEERLKAANDIIEFIVDRSKKGYDKNNRKFPGYSESYVKSLDFKIAGKSSRSVDLTLSGDMLAALKLISHKPGTLLIGFDNGTNENDRADGNITGSYGGSPNRKKARDFLGIQNKDLERILDFYGQEREE